jgi:hypothetical protein
MTTVDVLGTGDELTDESGGSVDVAMGMAIDPYRKSPVDTEPLWVDPPADRTTRVAPHVIVSPPRNELTDGTICSFGTTT